jgi:heme A synthase
MFKAIFSAQAGVGIGTIVMGLNIDSHPNIALVGAIVSIGTFFWFVSYVARQIRSQTLD